MQQNPIKKLNIVILAAGQGLRMQSRVPKMLHEVAGVPMLSRVLEAARALSPQRIYIIVAPDQKDRIADALAAVNGVNGVNAVNGNDFELVVQANAKGTGDALQVGLAAMAMGEPEAKDDVDVLVLCGDMPLLQAETLKKLCETYAQKENKASLALLAAELDHPFGYGRMLYDKQGRLEAIVEEAHLTAEQAQIKAVNTGVYLAAKSDFTRWLGKIEPNSHTQEAYLPDIARLAREDGKLPVVCRLQDSKQALGVNTRVQLAEAEAEQQKRLALALMQSGVTVASPDRLTIRGQVDFGQDCHIDVGAVLIGPLTVGENVRVGAYCILSRSRIAADVNIQAFSHIDNCVLGSAAQIGPFARLRDGTEVGERVEIGNFVETKASTLGAGTKAKHLAYLGDAQIGQNCNLGAGAITCNYDGQSKHQTKLGDNVFVGSNATLVAPIELSDGVYVGAGTTLAKDVAENKLVAEKKAELRIADAKRWKARRDAMQSARKT